jgi:predicted nucleotidyltransferase component of viral defense system
MKLGEVRDAYIKEGLSYLDATSRASQDAILSLIAGSPLSHNVTIKGGVVMQRVSGDSRRATQDFDFDFIRYSISDEAIIAFIERLNGQAGGLRVAITAPIEELKHQDYSGKRIYVSITDVDGTRIATKFDIGVHKQLGMEQEEYGFDLGKLDGSVTLLANTKEQIFTEKLKSLLRLGAISTRYKDVFDMFYLAAQGDMDRAVLADDIEALVFDDPTMREKDMAAVFARLDKVFHDQRFVKELGRSRRQNWIEANPKDALSGILDYIAAM